MKKEKLIVNGYIVPGGLGGVGVRKACETIIDNPGIPQIDLFEILVEYTRLNRSTAGWMVSPGGGPAEKLWTRKKESVLRYVGQSGPRHVFCCYPNEFTSRVVGSKEHLRLYWLSEQTALCKRLGNINVGDIVKWCSRRDPSIEHMGVFHGWVFREDVGPTKEVFPTPMAAVEYSDHKHSWWMGPLCANENGYFYPEPSEVIKLS